MEKIPRKNIILEKKKSSLTYPIKKLFVRYNGWIIQKFRRNETFHNIINCVINREKNVSRNVTQTGWKIAVFYYYFL